jgi:hypothetical protein
MSDILEDILNPENLEKIKDIIVKYEKIKKNRAIYANQYYHRTKGSYSKKHYQENKEKCLQYDREWKRNKYQNDEEYRKKVNERNRLCRERRKLLKESQQS